MFKKIILITVCCLLFISVVGGQAWGAPRKMVTLQGRLLNRDGSRIADGTNVTFTIPHDPNLAWTETWGVVDVPNADPGAGKLYVAPNGVFTVALGQQTNLPDDIFDTGFSKVQISVAGEQLGVQRLNYVPFAFYAANATKVGGKTLQEIQAGGNSGNFVNKTGDIMTGTLTVETANKFGLRTQTSANDGIGVFGHANYPGAFDENYGGFFIARGGKGVGVFGYGHSEQGGDENYGGKFTAMGGQGTGVYSEGKKYGVWGKAIEGSAYSGYFSGGRGVKIEGDIDITGNYKKNGQPIGSGGNFVSKSGDEMSGTLTVETFSKIGIIGRASASGANEENYGGLFSAGGGKGIGVYGLASAYGGKFIASGERGIGVHGEGKLAGGYFENLDGDGLLCTGTTGIRVDGRGTGPNGALEGMGIHASGGELGIRANSEFTGIRGFGHRTVGGSFESTYGVGVQGKGHTTGGYFEAQNGHGIFAIGNGEKGGIFGSYGNLTITDQKYGVAGVSNQGSGVYGEVKSDSLDNFWKAGVYGKGGRKTHGVFGYTSATQGIRAGVTGVGDDTFGVYGKSERGYGAYATSNSATKAAVFAENRGGGPALELGHGKIKINKYTGQQTVDEVTINQAVGIANFAYVSGHHSDEYVKVNNNQVDPSSIIFLSMKKIGTTSHQDYSVMVKDQIQGQFKIYIYPGVRGEGKVQVAFMVIN
ncbi:MAG: hypothetical protein ABID35_03210 [Candidatus Margulisiibacteriota bacterium]